MNDFIENNISFKYCYIFLISEILLVITYETLLKILFDYSNVLTIYSIEIILILFLDIYIYLGFIKYSYITDQFRLRIIIVIVIGISIIGSIFSFIEYGTGYRLPDVFSYLTRLPLINLLLFYGFKSFRSKEIDFFRGLSRLNLYLAVISFLSLFMLICQKYSLMGTVSEVIYVLSMVIGLFISIALLYSEFKLFKHLSTRYDAVP